MHVKLWNGSRHFCHWRATSQMVGEVKCTASWTESTNHLSVYARSHRKFLLHLPQMSKIHKTRPCPYATHTQVVKSESYSDGYLGHICSVPREKMGIWCVWNSRRVIGFLMRVRGQGLFAVYTPYTPSASSCDPPLNQFTVFLRLSVWSLHVPALPVPSSLRGSLRLCVLHISLTKREK